MTEAPFTEFSCVEYFGQNFFAVGLEMYAIGLTQGYPDTDTRTCMLPIRVLAGGNF